MVSFPKNFALEKVISVGLAAIPRRTAGSRVEAAVTPARAKPVRLMKSRLRMPYSGCSPLDPYVRPDPALVAGRSSAELCCGGLFYAYFISDICTNMHRPRSRADDGE